MMMMKTVDAVVWPHLIVATRKDKDFQATLLLALKVLMDQEPSLQDVISTVRVWENFEGTRSEMKASRGGR